MNICMCEKNNKYLHTKSLKQLKKKPDPGSGGEGLEGRIKQEIRDS